MSAPKIPNVSWVDGYGHRVFGYFVKWDGDFAVTRQANTMYKCRIYKANLSFEQG